MNEVSALKWSCSYLGRGGFSPFVLTHQSAALPKLEDCISYPCLLGDPQNLAPHHFSLTLGRPSLQVPPPLMSLASLLSCPTLPRTSEGLLTPCSFWPRCFQPGLPLFVGVWSLLLGPFYEMGPRSLRNWLQFLCIPCLYRSCGEQDTLGAASGLKLPSLLCV